MFNTKQDLEKLLSLIDSNDINTLRNILESKLNKIIKEEINKSKRNKKKLDRSTSSKESLEKIAKSFREKLIENQTDSEKISKAILKSININYEFQKIIYYKEKKKESFYIVDFYLSKYNIGIEIDGEYHKFQKSIDKKRTKVLKDLGLNDILRFKNEDTKTNIEYIKKAILSNKYISNLTSY
jgi:very-short-patch-repair endonuclease